MDKKIVLVSTKVEPSEMLEVFVQVARLYSQSRVKVKRNLKAGRINVVTLQMHIHDKNLEPILSHFDEVMEQVEQHL